MGFWRREVIDFALGYETRRQIAEQREWIAREPQNAVPYYNLAQLYRIESRQHEALELLLEAVRLDPELARAHAALAEINVVRGDMRAAWCHARAAERHGEPRAVELLKRYGVEE